MCVIIQMPNKKKPSLAGTGWSLKSLLTLTLLNFKYLSILNVESGRQAVSKLIVIRVCVLT